MQIIYFDRSAAQMRTYLTFVNFLKTNSFKSEGYIYMYTQFFFLKNVRNLEVTLAS